MKNTSEETLQEKDKDVFGFKIPSRSQTTGEIVNHSVQKEENHENVFGMLANTTPN